MQRIVADLAQAVRLFRASPGFASAVIGAIALGIGMILRQGGAVVAAGVVVGLGAAFYLSSFLASALFGVAPRDGAVFAAVPAVLLLIGLGTVGIVARRAGSVDPLAALRHE